MKAVEVHKSKVEYTLSAFGKILKETDDRINKNEEELNDLEQFSNRIFSDKIESRISYLHNQIEKDYHMKFHLKNTFDHFDNLDTKLMISISEIND